MITSAQVVAMSINVTRMIIIYLLLAYKFPSLFGFSTVIARGWGGGVGWIFAPFEKARLEVAWIARDY